MSAPRPLASPEDIRLVRDLYPTHLSPGEYAVRYSDDRAIFRYAERRYPDPRLDRWIQTVARILASPALLERCRARWRAEHPDAES